MKWASFLIFFLIIPIFASSAVNEASLDNIVISFEFNSPEEIVAHYEAQIYYGVTFDFTLSEYQNVSSVIINNFTISYFAVEDEDRELFDHRTYLDVSAKNTSNPNIYEYEKNPLEQLKSNPFTTSKIEVELFVDFTISNQNSRYNYSLSSIFNGPTLYNPLSIADIIRSVIIIGIILVIIGIIIIKKRKKLKNIELS